MGIEIERKFLLATDQWRNQIVSSETFRQGYLTSAPEGPTVRVRSAGQSAWLTVKGKTRGVSRLEFEYPIPAADAADLLALCSGPIIEKVRHIVPSGKHRWEIDEFTGDNAGLVVAEIELASESEAFDRPDWLGMEVSDDSRYANAALSDRPYSTWAGINQQSG